MRNAQSAHYKLNDLVEQSGFDKRTIAYYVQESLLPRVGRRGPRTRYSQEFLDRLMFIRRVRDLQDDGRLRAVTLSEIRDVIEQQSPEEIQALAGEDVSADTLRGLFDAPDLDTSDLAFAAEDIARAPASLPPTLPDDGFPVGGRGVRSAKRRRAMYGRTSFGLQDLADLLREVHRRARAGAKRTRLKTGERVTRVPISEEIYLSVRNLDESDVPVVERLANAMRDLGGLDAED